MTGAERRKQLLETLRNADTPCSGAALGEHFGVSRQIVVQDIALLRSQGNEIISTNRGYLVPKTSDDARRTRPERVFKVHHTPPQAEEEMTCIVDLGGYIEDISIEHRVYGSISAPLNVGSRRDVARFMESIASGTSAQLSTITAGYHFHRVTAESEEVLDEIAQALADRGFAVPASPRETEK